MPTATARARGAAERPLPPGRGPASRGPAGRQPGSGRGTRPARTPGKAPAPIVVNVALAVLGLGFGATVASAVTSETWSQLRAPGGMALFIGGLTGLAGTYLALVMVLLVSRVPHVERVLGQDGLLRWHRRLSPWPISLITAHVVTLTVGYAEAAKRGTWHEVATIVATFPWMVEATAAFLLMLVVALVSIRAVRQRVGRERWWAFHLSMYLVLALSFFHTIALGPSFVGHPLARALWLALWLATAGFVIAYRFGLPIVRSFRHRLQVVEVRPEAPGVVSVICRGRKLERLAVSGGQFFEWRFLARKMWWQAHPFSLSALPTPPYLRLTVKARGDFSASLASVRPGTRVAIEGPYGAFTAHARRRRKAALIAGGIGVTAVRSLLEDLSPTAEPVVILRASSREDLALSGEVAELAHARKGRVHELVGPRDAVRPDRLAELVPDLRKRDVFVAGPEEFVKWAVAALGRLGVPKEAVHFEEYALG
jgi:predicted ferric reductase